MDTLRAAALIGICVVNLPFLGLPAELASAGPADIPGRAATVLVELLFQGKFFLLFSFVFGWGVQVQMQSAERAGVPFAGRYFRRLGMLAVLGVLHAVLVFPGDILLIYAMLGVLLWPLRRVPVAWLVRIAGAMVVIEIASLGLLALLLAKATAMPVPHSLGGGFAEATLARLWSWPDTLGFLLLFQGPLAFGAFALGLAAARTDFFSPGSAGRRGLARAAPWLLLVALPLNLLFAFAPGDDSPWALAGLLAFALGAPALSAVYLQALLWLDARIRLPERLVVAGRNSLTAYVLQGCIAGVIFGGHGFGLFGAVGPMGLMLLAVLVALLAMLCTSAMAGRSGHAPLERLLRRATYGRQAA